MIRGTTPTLSFELPTDTGELSEVWITISQKGSIVLNKTLSDCTLSGNTLTVTLTQQETLLFENDGTAEIQLRARLTGGAAVASAIIPVETDRILKDGVI